MKKKIIFLLFLFCPILTFSQDLIILKNGERVYCKITKIDSLKVYYAFSQNDKVNDSYSNKSDIRSYQCYSKGIDVKTENDTLRKAEMGLSGYSKGNNWTS